MEERDNARHVVRALESAQAAVRISNKGTPYTTLSQGDLVEIRAYKKAALEDAKRVQDHVLDKIHPEIRTHFRDEFQRGLELQLRNLTSGDVASEVRGSALVNRWADWFNSNRSQIKIPK